MLLITLGSPGLDLIKKHLSTLTVGYQKRISDDNVVVYDLVEVENGVNGILLYENLRRIVSTIINFIRRNKVDRFKVRGSFLYLPTGWHNTKVGVCRDISMMEDRTCNYAMLLSPYPVSFKGTFIRSRSSVLEKYLA